MHFIAKDFNELSAKEVYEILKSRCKVFMLEQNIVCLDMDGVDYVSKHFFLQEENEVLAYLRAFYTDESKNTVKIGRMLSLTHGIGHGKKVLSQAIDYIKSNMPCSEICLNAQKQAKGFYEKMGFKVVSNEFLEEGVVHVKMSLKF